MAMEVSCEVMAMFMNIYSGPKAGNARAKALYSKSL